MTTLEPVKEIEETQSQMNKHFIPPYNVYTVFCATQLQGKGNIGSQNL